MYTGKLVFSQVMKQDIKKLGNVSKIARATVRLLPGLAGQGQSTSGRRFELGLG